jgi:hypothetical protein
MYNVFVAIGAASMSDILVPEASLRLATHLGKGVQTYELSAFGYFGTSVV